MHRRATVLAVLIAVIAACDTSLPPSATPAGTPAVVPGSAGPPGDSAGPDGSLGPPGPPLVIEPEPIPQPRLSEPFDIGQSLYDPLLMPVAVVSLLHQVGVAITTDAGVPLRPADDRGSASISLTESEVRGWIEMTNDELLASDGETPGRSSIADLHRALQSSLPAGYSLEAFAAAYDAAYSQNPDAFVAQVMLGQPIEPGTRLLRIQAWLLLLDGFAPHAAAASGSVALAAFRPSENGGDGVASLAGAPAIGVAARFQPPLTSPIDHTSDATWLVVLATLPTLAYRVPFVVEGGRSVHEGHGRPGDRLDLRARYERPVSFGINQDFIFLGEDPGQGLQVRWTSLDEAQLRRHGQVTGGALNTDVPTDAGGAVTIGYQTIQERARQRQVEVSERVSLNATVDQIDLVIWAFDLEPEVLAVLECQCLIVGTRTASPGSFPVAWHAEEALEVSIDNYYDYSFSVGGIATLHRDGVDKVAGTLTKGPDDGTWRGTMEALNSGHATGTAVLGAAGIAECGGGDVLLGGQTLYVVGEPEAGNELRLRFYPETPPEGGETACQAYIPFPGGGRYRRPAGSYVPLNDTRWSTPDRGYVIEIPTDFERISYVDQSAMAAELGICSAFYVTVNRVDPNQPFPTPTPVPPSRPMLCQ